MLAAKGLLDALSDDKISDQKNQNQDYDFDKVLDFCSGNTDAISEYKIRYADQQE